MMNDHYYPSITYKMTQMLHGGCNQAHYQYTRDNFYNKSNTHSSSSLDPFMTKSESHVPLQVIERPPSIALQQFWTQMLPPLQMRVDHDMCVSSLTRKNKSLLRNAVGCNTPHLLPPAHPRCQGALLTQHCFEGSQNSSTFSSTAPKDVYGKHQYILKEADHAHWPHSPVPFLLRATNALVDSCGHINLDCGFLQTNVNCRAPGDHAYAQAFKAACPTNKELLQASKKELPENNYLAINCSSRDPYHQYQIRQVRRVFVVAQVDDTHIYHTHMEIVPRIVYFMDLLRRYPDMMILFGCDRMQKDKTQTRRILNSGKQNLLRILSALYPDMEWQNRIVVQEHIFAQEVYLPMEGGCQDPMYNTWMVMQLRQTFLYRLSLISSLAETRPAHFLDRTIAAHKRRLRYAATSVVAFTVDSFVPSTLPLLQRHDSLFKEYQQSRPPHSKPVLTIIKRSANSQFTRNSADLVRAWTDDFAQELVHSFVHALPQYEIRLFSDRNVSLLSCFACQVRAMYETDVLVGIHGAGLGMALYMPPTSVMIEIAPYTNDGRLMLGGGPFSRVAAVMSQHYYAHYIAYPEFVWESKSKTSRFNISRLVQSTTGYLHSIDYL
jgi:hypothetical protein